MLDRRRTRQRLLFLGNVLSGVVTVFVAFFCVAWADEIRSFVPLLILVAVPALGTRGWRSGLERRSRERGLVKRVAWQAFWVLIAWEAVGVVLVGTLLYFAYSAMAPVPHFDNTSVPIALIVISALVVLVVWFTWVKSRRMLDLLWPVPGMPERGSESPYL
jgi:hypothetical protein